MIELQDVTNNISSDIEDRIKIKIYNGIAKEYGLDQIDENCNKIFEDNKLLKDYLKQFKDSIDKIKE